MKKANLISLALFLSSINLSAATIINENFSTFKISDHPYISSTGGYAVPCDSNCKDPDTLADNEGQPPMTLIMPSLPATYDWAMVISNAYPLSFKGSGPTQSWAYDAVPGQLRYHAERTPYDWGFAWIHKTALDHNKFLVVESSLTIDSCFGNGICTNGPALINTEADYRAVYLQGTSNSSELELRRYAPRDERQFYYSNGTKVKLYKGDIAKIRITYAGASEKSWRYWLNDNEIFIKSGNQIQTTEKSNFLNALLRADPRVGIYPNVNGSSVGNYIEGRIFWIKAAQLEKVNFVSATASNSALSSPPQLAIDNDSNTAWNSGGYAPHSIELNLGTIKSVKKIRLLVSQHPAGATTHNIYVGQNPNPTKLVATIAQNTNDNSWLDIDLSANGEAGQYVLIKTTNSPSWVSWREIEVYE